MPDRAIGNSGIITWGTNPANIDVTIGSMASSGTAGLGTSGDVPSRDLMPKVAVSDWYQDPNLVTLATNPLRPLVTILSDTTTLTELQAWRWFGLILILLITGLAIRAVPRHLAIASVASGATCIYLVVSTIWPGYALVWLVFCIIGGWISERSPSV